MSDTTEESKCKAKFHRIFQRNTTSQDDFFLNRLGAKKSGAQKSEKKCGCNS